MTTETSNEVYLPEYSIGTCAICGTYRELGDGLCQKCWDGPEELDHRFYQARTEYRNSEILKMTALGYKPKVIARVFSIRPSTVLTVQREAARQQ